MDYEALKKMPHSERKDTLEGLMLNVEETNYMKPLTQDEIEQQRINLTAALIEKALIEDSFRIEKEKHKLKIAPIAAAAKAALDAVRVGSIAMMGKVYNIPDYDNKVVVMVDEFGNFLASRPMKPTERQIPLTHDQAREKMTKAS